MSSQVSAEQAYAFAELLEILSFLNKSLIDKIPSKMMNVFTENALTTYENHLDKNVPIHEQTISKKTSSLIAIIALRYWCKSDKEVSALKRIIANNDKKVEEEKREQFNPENIFNKPESAEHIKESEPVQLVDYQSLPWYKKIFTPLKKLTYNLFKKTNNQT